MTVGGACWERIDDSLLPLLVVAARRTTAVQVPLVGLAARWGAAFALPPEDEVAGAAAVAVVLVEAADCRGTDGAG